MKVALTLFAAVVSGLVPAAVAYPLAWLAVYVPSARSMGTPMFTRRRLRAWITRTAECVGGPFDGSFLPVRREVLTGVKLGDWPDVLYDATTGRYVIVPDGTYKNHRDTVREVWAGSYNMHHLSDRFVWRGTGLERYANDRVAKEKGWRA